MTPAVTTRMMPALIGMALGTSVLAFSVKALALLLAAMIGMVLAASSVAAYYALVATVPVQVDFLGGLTVTKLLVPFSIGVVVFNALTRRGPWPVLLQGPASYLAWSFFVVSVISVLYAEGIGQFPGEAAKVPVFASLFFFTLTFIRTPEQFHRLLWVNAIAGTVEAVITVAQVHFGFIMPGDWRNNLGLPIEGALDGGALTAMLEGKVRAEGTTAHPILLASYYLMTIPCTICLFLLEENRSKKLLLSGMVALMSYGWYYTFARSSMIGFALMIVVALAFYSKAARVAIFMGIGLAATGFLSYQAISDTLSAGVQTIEQQGWFASADVNSANSSWQFRLESIVGGWNLFLAHPWLGVGFGQALYHYTTYLPSWANHIAHPSVIHNVFLEVGSELGVFSLAAFFSLLMWAFVCAKRGLHLPTLRPYAILMCCVLAGQIAFLMITPMVREIWLTIPMAVALGHMNRKAEP
ncbi:MAG: O-antigen ligase family protein [Nitrospira sp.]|nr:O-antigen ligase family protein [Nitrospira sp.]